MLSYVYTLTILARCFSSFGWKLCIDSLVPCRTKSGRYVDELLAEKDREFNTLIILVDAVQLKF